MKEVWKFYVYSDRRDISMPAGSEPLHVGSQDGRVVLWAGVDPTRPRVMRRFFIIATGQPFEPKGLLYIGTTQAGPYVWHVFEEVA